MMKLLVELNDLKLLETPCADAFLVGAKDVSLRPSKIFTDFEIIKERAKALNKKVFLNAMAQVKENELEVFLKKLEKLIPYFDGVFYTDLAVYQALNEMDYQGIKVYFPTTYITSSKERDFFLKYNDIVLASPEVNTEELENIVNEHTAVLVFGAYALFYSARKLLTRYYEYRNLPISSDFSDKSEAHFKIKEEFREELYPVTEDEEGFHIFSNGHYVMLKEKILDNAAYGVILTPFLNYEKTLVVLETIHAAAEKELTESEAFDKLQNLNLPIGLTTGMANKKTILTKESNNG